MATWMNRRLTDAQRVAQAKEIEPGILASPWERDECSHHRAYPVRWRWHEGDDIEDAEPEYGKHGCLECGE